MDGSENKWYYKPWVIVLAILGFGPLGLLPLWFRPKTSIVFKVLVSVIVFALTVWFITTTLEVLQSVMEQYKELAKIME